MATKLSFKSFYSNRPAPVGTDLDTETKLVDQSEADRASLSYQLERFGMDGLQQKLEQTKAQFGYADTRLSKDFQQLAEKMAEANSYFMQLPAKIRKEFGHDPVEFYSQIEKDPASMFSKGFISEKLATDLGVVTKPVENKPIENNISSESVDNKKVSAE